MGVSFMTGYYAPIAIHPGETLKEWLEDLNITQLHFSHMSGLPCEIISQIVNCKIAITNDMAIKLSKALKTSISFWNNLQKSYEETLERLKEKRSIK
jgi:HTH-type transcriptional regulator/antitoxin HigA